jgi:hypothetical protein
LRPPSVLAGNGRHASPWRHVNADQNRVDPSAGIPQRQLKHILVAPRTITTSEVALGCIYSICRRCHSRRRDGRKRRPFKTSKRGQIVQTEVMPKCCYRREVYMYDMYGPHWDAQGRQPRTPSGGRAGWCQYLEGSHALAVQTPALRSLHPAVCERDRSCALPEANSRPVARPGGCGTEPRRTSSLEMKRWPGFCYKKRRCPGC